MPHRHSLTCTVKCSPSAVLIKEQFCFWGCHLLSCTSMLPPSIPSNIWCPNQQDDSGSHVPAPCISVSFPRPISHSTWPLANLLGLNSHQSQLETSGVLACKVNQCGSFPSSASPPPPRLLLRSSVPQSSGPVSIVCWTACTTNAAEGKAWLMSGGVPDPGPLHNSGSP